MKLLPLILLALAGVAEAQDLPPLLPPVQVPTRTWKPVQYVQQTNIVMQWSPYTNACFVVSNSTDLVNWTVCCYVPICQTNISIPTTNGSCFYKVATVYMP